MATEVIIEAQQARIEELEDRLTELEQDERLVADQLVQLENEIWREDSWTTLGDVVDELLVLGQQLANLRYEQEFSHRMIADTGNGKF